jgi:hypothetical protein
MPELNEGVQPTTPESQLEKLASTPDRAPESTAPTPENNIEQSVLMPRKEELISKLKETKFFGTNEITDPFYENFIDKVSDRSKSGRQLYADWQTVKYYTLSNPNLPPVFKKMVDMDFERTIDALTPDPKVAGDAKKINEEIEAKLKQLNEENK